MRYLISVSYDGSKYYGFQRQKGKVSVQEELEKALTKINRKKILVKGAGRTDRGVHAIDQKVHFDLNVLVPEDRLVNAINSIVSPYIKVNSAKYVKDDFHARFNCVKKTYTYIINLGDFDPIRHDYLYNYNHSLNINKMKKASKVLLGAHNFESFVSGARESSNSIIYNIRFKKEKKFLYITFVGKSFYRYMVRNLVGALMEIGTNKRTKEDLFNFLNNSAYDFHYTTAPASGLYLISVEY